MAQVVWYNLSKCCQLNQSQCGINSTREAILLSFDKIIIRGFPLDLDSVSRTLRFFLIAYCQICWPYLLKDAFSGRMEMFCLYWKVFENAFKMMIKCTLACSIWTEQRFQSPIRVFYFFILENAIRFFF